MGPKKGLSDFIKKNKKKEKKTGGAAEATSAPTTGEQVKAADAEVAKTQQSDAKNAPGAKQADSSDEEEDELELANKHMSYGNIKENKDIASAANKDKDEKMGYGLDEGQEESKVANADGKAKLAGPKKAFGESITFSKPSFGRRKPAAGNGGKFGNDDFKEGLDDIDDDGSVKKKESKSRAEGGQGGFVNLGVHSQPRGPRDVEEKRVPTEKPKFRGRMNLNRNPVATEEIAGAKQDYNFGVVYKSEIPDGERREPGSYQRDRKPYDKGEALGAKEKAAEEDNEFTVVRNKDRTRKIAKAGDSDSSEDDSGAFRPRGQIDSVRGARVERGGNRGGRGGFFKSSVKAKNDE